MHTYTPPDLSLLARPPSPLPARPAGSAQSRAEPCAAQQLPAGWLRYVGSVCVSAALSETPLVIVWSAGVGQAGMSDPGH